MGSRDLYRDIGLLVILLVVISVIATGFWEFAFSSLVGWSVGSLIFKYLDRDEEEETRAEEKRSFLAFAIVVIILTIAGAILSNWAEQSLSQFIKTSPELTNSIIHLWYQPPNVGYNGGALIFYISLSFLACLLVLADFRVKRWSQIHFPQCRKLRRLLKLEKG